MWNFFKALIVPHYFGFHFYNLFKIFTFVHLTFYGLFWQINWLLGIFFALSFFFLTVSYRHQIFVGNEWKILGI